ncbi:MAG TPA: hypothetical protein VK186_19415 [Candidatus Deferrimicrobium sp.]|nr:hypothetical protein [Candidatus Deferrimicrobium sp.]
MGVNSHITLVAAVELLNSDNPGNGSSSCFLLRVTIYSKAAILPGLMQTFAPVIAGKKSRTAVLIKLNDNPGSSPVKKKFSPVRFWKPSDDLQKLSVDLQKLSVGLQKYSVDLQNLSAGLQKYSVDLQKLSADLQKYSVDLQNLSVGLQKYSVDLQKLSADLQKYSADLQKLSADLQKSPVEFKIYCANYQKRFDVFFET